MEAELLRARTQLSQLEIASNTHKKKYMFFMTQHPRVGGESIWHGLPDDVLQVISEKVDEI